MKGALSSGITPTITFILSILAILVIAVSAPGMVQAVLDPTASPGDAQPGSAIQAAPYYGPMVNPAANFGSLTDNGTAAYMGIGIATPASPLHIYSTSSTQPETIDLDGTQPITAQWNDYCNTGGSMSGSGFLARFARGSQASPQNVQPGDRLGFNVFGGWAGGAFRHTGAIEAMVDTGTVSASSLPTYMRFLTTPDGSTTRVERMRITSDGRVSVNTTTPDPRVMLAAQNYNTADNATAVGGQTSGGNTAGVGGRNTAASTWGGLGCQSQGYGSGVLGGSDNTSSWGFLGGSSTTKTGIGAYGQNNISGDYGGLGSTGAGAYGITNNTNQSGVYGQTSAANSAGVYGHSTNSSVGVQGDCTSSSGTGVYGKNLSGGWAGYFDGPVNINGALTATSKSFVAPDPTDPTKDIYYACLEGPENGTYIRGSANLVDGRVTIQLPDHFAKVTADNGITVQFTPVGKWLQLYAIEKTTSLIVVGEATGQSGSFDYVVNGVRKGYENFQVVRDGKALKVPGLSNAATLGINGDLQIPASFQAGPLIKK